MAQEIAHVRDRHLDDSPSVAVWDLPVRAVHWLIVALVLGAWITADEFKLVHRLAGYGVLALVAFRVYWGIAGSTTARFAHFVAAPRAVVRYARGLFTRPGEITLGHNPMGGWSVAALLLLLAATALLGLFSVDVDGTGSGPLADFVSFDAGRMAADLHALVFDLLALVVAIHIVAVLFYLLFKKENLVAAMITGRKRAPSSSHTTLVFAPVRRAVIAIAVTALIVAAIANVGLVLAWLP